MNISNDGLALIKQFEGFAPHLYLCPAGKPTIGYGHVLEKVSSGQNSVISEEDAENLLLQDLAPVEQAINHLVTATLSQSQFDALCSFVFNVGVCAFAGSTLLKKINAGAADASKQFLQWIYGGGKPLPGLIKRRQMEKELYDKTIT